MSTLQHRDGYKYVTIVQHAGRRRRLRTVQGKTQENQMSILFSSFAQGLVGECEAIDSV
ncbi:MAG: hypothetical protein M3275_07790 [Thermoproteota archaeon]|nr:hypothetical protein [Thermoproteota archaeon]